MIQFGPQAQIFVMHESISFRLGIDGTIAIARLVLQKEPMSGAYFLFKGKMGHSLRILFYDGGGFWLCTRRLSKGRFRHWPEGDGTAACHEMLAREVQILIWGGDPECCNFPDLWRKIA